MDVSYRTTAPPVKATNSVYFPGLNALRYFAAAAVVFCHVEEVKLHYHLPNHYAYFLVHGAGALAVTFFFVLSGFLITYLLLKEKTTYQTVAVRSFYIRRALRIWPVYYLISFLGLVVLPFSPAFAFPAESAKVVLEYPLNGLLYVFFLPNIALWLNYFVPYASQLWSVGVEEQFYVFWPWLFKLIKRPLPSMVAVVALFFIGRVGLYFGGTYWLSGHWHNIAIGIYNLLEMTRIDCMAIGGIGAYFIYNEHRWFRRYFINRTAEIASLGALAVFFVLFSKVVSVETAFIEIPLYALAFLALLVNISCGEQSLLRLEGRLWTFLGNISYSVYMYQYLAIGAIFFLFRKAQLVSFSPLYNTLFHVTSQVAVVLLAYTSYRFFELPFLKLKGRYALVKSATVPEAGS